MVYASFGRRFGAALVDGIIGWVIAMILYPILHNPFAGVILFGLLYQPLFECSALQATPGKALLGMHITDLQGRRITFKAAIIRYFMRIVSGIILLIGYLIQPFTEKKQALHDIVAETLVVRGEIQNVNYFQAWYQQLQETLGMVDKTPGSRNSDPVVKSMEPTPADLAGLYDLFQKGILTEAEYNQKREELLKRL
jgi:uncharacterized RDD family membrane protein YckC